MKLVHGHLHLCSKWLFFLKMRYSSPRPKMGTAIIVLSNMISGPGTVAMLLRHVTIYYIVLSYMILVSQGQSEFYM